MVQPYQTLIYWNVLNIKTDFFCVGEGSIRELEQVLGKVSQSDVLGQMSTCCLGPFWQGENVSG